MSIKTLTTTIQYQKLFVRSEGTYVKNHIHMLPKGIQLANIKIFTLCRYMHTYGTQGIQ
jgi:hypothetical protein